LITSDASEGVTEQDAKIAGIAHDRGKGIIVAVNKWDAIEKNDKTIYKHTEKIRQILSSCSVTPSEASITTTTTSARSTAVTVRITL